MPYTTPLVTTTQLAERVGVDLDGPNDEARAMACIEEASALVVAEAGAAGTAWTDPGHVPDVIQAVVIAVASRTFRNPDGIVSQSVGGVTETLPASSVTAFLTEYERGLVRRTAGLTSLSPRLATVRVTRGDSAPAEQSYLGTSDGSTEPVPWFPDWAWQ